MILHLAARDCQSRKLFLVETRCHASPIDILRDFPLCYAYRLNSPDCATEGETECQQKQGWEK